MWKLLPFICVLQAINCFSQQTPSFKGALKANREKFYKTAVEKTIHKNLSTPLSDSTEEQWQSAFSAIELLNYQTPFVKNKMKEASAKLPALSIDFQKNFWTLSYKRFPIVFADPAKKTFDTTKNHKLMALCGEYLLNDGKLNLSKYIFSKIEKDLVKDTLLKLNPFYVMLAAHARMKMGFGMERPAQRAMNLLKFVPEFLSPGYLPGNVIVYSFQRKNRDYPGLAIVRNRDGSFVKKTDSTLFSVPQLARSTNNLPGYITNGNTPQGVFRMKGFEVSTLAFIGPTENIQLMLPVETTKANYFKDSTIANNEWNVNDYAGILPNYWRKNFFMYEAWYAGLAGRTEIIAHGTTVDPDFYKGSAYYPHTPTSGCLCTKEFWSEADGKRTESNQQKLVDAVKSAGGADGYLIVIELEDEKKPVTLQDVLPYMKSNK